MPRPFYELLKKFLWPRYREENPPSYINSFLFEKDFIDSEGQIREPVKSILNLITLGHRPVTTLALLDLLVENRNKPMYGTQLGKEMEKRFQLPEGWFSKTRYYDNRVGKLLKMLVRLDILEEVDFVDSKTRRRHLGYRIAKNIYPGMQKNILNFMQSGTLPIFVPIETYPKLPEAEQLRIIKHCTKCQAQTTSLQAQYCEICGSPLVVVCPKCKRENIPEYTYCVYCRERLVQ